MYHVKKFQRFLNSFEGEREEISTINDFINQISTFNYSHNLRD